MRVWVSPRLAASITGIALMIVLGCGGGGDEFPKRYPVTGKVILNGKPATKGSVTFSPVDAANGRAAGGEIQPNGTYRLTTVTPGDGALPGKYLVSISGFEIDREYVRSKLKQGVDPRELNLIGETKYDEQAPKKYHVPPKYMDASKSGLTAEVKPESNVIDFTLKD